MGMDETKTKEKFSIKDFRNNPNIGTPSLEVPSVFLDSLKSKPGLEQKSSKKRRLLFGDITWTTNGGSVNRHTSYPDTDGITTKISRSDERFIQFLTIFQKYLKPIFSEMLATWLLVFWACMLQPGPGDAPDDPSYVLVPAFSAGIMRAVIIAFFWDICVIQINPAISLAYGLSGIISRRLVIPNIIAQCIGSVIAAYMAAMLRGQSVGMIPITEDSNLSHIFWAEFAFTFAMTLVALASLVDTDYYHPLTPLVIGLTVTQGVFGGWYIGAGCMNPARVFGPAAASGDWNHHWIWWLSEFAGAGFAVVVEGCLLAPVTSNTATRSPLWWAFPEESVSSFIQRKWNYDFENLGDNTSILSGKPGNKSISYFDPEIENRKVEYIDTKSKRKKSQLPNLETIPDDGKEFKQSHRPTPRPSFGNSDPDLIRAEIEAADAEYRRLKALSSQLRNSTTRRRSNAQPQKKKKPVTYQRPTLSNRLAH